MSHQPGVLEAIRDYGFDPILVDGWETRGSSTFNPRGSVNHHTAGAATGILPSLQILINGRPGVPGPLCNSALDRLNRIWMIAAGRANHAGEGGWAGLSGNSSVWGLEVEHVGTTAEPVSPEKWDAMHRWHAAVADYSGFNPLVYECQHFEWAPTRKIDFVKSITDGNQFRRDVNAKSPIIQPIPPPAQLGDLVPFPVITTKPDGIGRHWTALLPGKLVVFNATNPGLPEASDPQARTVWAPNWVYDGGVASGWFLPVKQVDTDGRGNPVSGDGSILMFDRACAAAQQFSGLVTVGQGDNADDLVLQAILLDLASVKSDLDHLTELHEEEPPVPPA